MARIRVIAGGGTVEILRDGDVEDLRRIGKAAARRHVVMGLDGVEEIVLGVAGLAVAGAGDSPREAAEAAGQRVLRIAVAALAAEAQHMADLMRDGGAAELAVGEVEAGGAEIDVAALGN